MKVIYAGFEAEFLNSIPGREPPGNHDALAATLMEVAAQRQMLPLVGRANADLIRLEYLVEHYADRVVSFYQEILGDDPRGSRP